MCKAAPSTTNRNTSKSTSINVIINNNHEQYLK